jgi:hypothetical protein
VLASNNFERCPPSVNQLAPLATMVEACDLLQTPTPAEALYRELKPHEDLVNVVGYGYGCWGAVARSLGQLATILERWEEAEHQFERALQLHARIGSTVWTVRTRYNYARMLMARSHADDRRRARAQVAQALPLATKCGMRVIEERLRRLASELAAST